MDLCFKKLPLHYIYIRIILLTLIGTLAACGGDDSSSNELSFNLSSGSVTFTANQDDSGGGNSTVTATAVNGTVYIEVLGAGATVVCNSSDTCDITIPGINNPGAQTVGTTNATVTVNGYKFLGSPTPFLTKTISVSYEITEGLQVNPSSITFTAVESETPAPQNLNETHSQSLAWSLTSGAFSGGSWLSTNISSGTTPSTTIVSADPILAGSYSGYINYTHGLTTEQKNVFVSYTAEPMLEASSLSFDITETSQPADLSQDLIIGLNANATTSPNISWTASSDKPWLNLDISNGNTTTNNTINLSLIVSELNKLPNGNYTADITITPDDANYSPITVTVSLSLVIPQFNFVTPNVVYSGGNASLTIRGDNIASDVTSVVINGSNVNVTRVNNTTLTLTQPASLTTGNYPIGINIPTGINNSPASLNVVGAPTFNYFKLALAGSKDRILFDAKRNVILVASRSTQQLHRIVFNGTDWDLEQSKSIPNLYDIDLTPDSEVILATNQSKILHLNAVTLDQTKSTTTPDTSFTQPRSIKTVDDGNALVFVNINNETQDSGKHIIYDYAHDDFPSSSAFGGIVPPTTLESSPDRKFIIAATITSGISGKLYNNGLTLTTQTSGTRYPLYMSLSTTGNRGVSHDYVWSITPNTSFGYIGNILDGGTTIKSVVTQDGTTVYSYDTNGSIRSFDLTDTSTTFQFPETGTELALIDTPGNNTLMEITPDGNHLIIGGDTNLLITPVP